MMILLRRTWRRWQYVYLDRWLPRLRQISFHPVDAVVEMGQQSTADYWFQLGKPTNLLGTLVESSLEFIHHIWVGCLRHSILLTLEVLQMLHRHLQNVSLFQLRVTCRVFLHCIQDEGLQLVQAVVNSRSTTLLHDGLVTPAIVTGPLDWLLGRWNL